MIIAITVLLIIIYKTHLLRRLLDRMQTDAPAEIRTRPPELTERQKLEMQARYIIKRQGQNPETVAYMSDGLLQAIIIDFKNEIKKGGN